MSSGGVGSPPSVGSGSLGSGSVSSGDVGTIAALYDFIRPFKRALVCAHANPDADAYGSSCGLALGLRQLGMETQIFNETGVISRYASIPGVDEVTKELPSHSSLAHNTIVIVCDCGAVERLGDNSVPWFKELNTIVNIDHHNGNTQFGKFNLVHESASSTSEIIFSLLRHAENMNPGKDVITTAIAGALMAGIIGDTGSFRYPSTTQSTFLAAAELYGRGARPSDITRDLFASVSLPALRLQSEALAKIALHFDARFAEVTVPSELVTRLGADLLDSDSLAERARDVRGVCVAALYKQDGEMWRVSLRSRSAEYDVSGIARSFGGGGHKPAAAFRWRKNLAELQAELRIRVSQLLDDTFDEMKWSAQK